MSTQPIQSTPSKQSSPSNKSVRYTQTARQAPKDKLLSSIILSYRYLARTKTPRMTAPRKQLAPDASSKDPTQTQTPTPTTQPPPTQEPIPFTQSSTTQEPIPFTQPSTTQEPIPFTQSPTTQEPIPFTQPPPTQEPIPFAQSPTTQDPILTIQEPNSDSEENIDVPHGIPFLIENVVVPDLLSLRLDLTLKECVHTYPYIYGSKNDRDVGSYWEIELEKDTRHLGYRWWRDLIFEIVISHKSAVIPEKIKVCLHTPYRWYGDSIGFDRSHVELELVSSSKIDQYTYTSVFRFDDRSLNHVGIIGALSIEYHSIPFDGDRYTKGEVSDVTSIEKLYRLRQDPWEMDGIMKDVVSDVRFRVVKRHVPFRMTAPTNIPPPISRSDSDSSSDSDTGKSSRKRSHDNDAQSSKIVKLGSGFSSK